MANHRLCLFCIKAPAHLQRHHYDNNDEGRGHVQRLFFKQLSIVLYLIKAFLFAGIVVSLLEVKK